MFDDVYIDSAEYGELKPVGPEDTERLLASPNFILSVKNLDEFVAWEQSGSDDTIELEVEISFKGFNSDEKYAALKNILTNLAGQL
jgi:hypothetical protein